MVCDLDAFFSLTRFTFLHGTLPICLATCQCFQEVSPANAFNVDAARGLGPLGSGNSVCNTVDARGPAPVWQKAAFVTSEQHLSLFFNFLPCWRSPGFVDGHGDDGRGTQCFFSALRRTGRSALSMHGICVGNAPAETIRQRRGELVARILQQRERKKEKESKDVHDERETLDRGGSWDSEQVG
ncbi:hypothetical protein QBC43DRAFT_93392 [Cladorrhinum sp. PSN259]|nr:hypothetical protein QBC43DRAFT_93392 [Cladorrhinum sp. PSN259]